MNVPSRFIKEIDSSLLDIENPMLEEKEKIDKKDLYSNDSVEYKSGDVVMHTIYGRGVVIDVNDSLVTVAFAKNFGIKKLMKNHKSLRKMS